VTLSGYSYGAYTANDVSAIVIDLVGNYGVALISFITLVALGMLYIYLKKKVR
jgi:apolipoprotein N-acyltransferase